MLKTSKRSGLKPGSTSSAGRNFSSSARRPTSRTNDNAISTAIRTERAGLLPNELPRSPSRSDSFGLAREAKRAGARPKSVPVMSGDKETEGEHLAVEPDAVEVRDLRRAERKENRQRPEWRGGCRAHHQASARSRLSVSKLPNQSESRRAERSADRNLARAGGGAGEEQVGDIGAGDEQDKADRAEQHEEHRPKAADRFLVHRNERRRRCPDLSFGYCFSRRCAIALIWACACGKATRPVSSVPRHRDNCGRAFAGDCR